MDRERLEKIKKIKQDTKGKYKGKKKDKLTQKEINELVIKIAEMLNLLEGDDIDG